jgi:Zn-dependent protease with chaperone function
MSSSSLRLPALLGAGVLMIALGVAAHPRLAAPLPQQPAPAASAASADDAFPSVTVTPEMRAHQRWVDALYFAGEAYGLLVLVAVLVLGISRRLRDLAARITRRPALMAMVFFAMFSVTMAILTLPMDWLADFRIPHQFGLSGQSFGGWLWDDVKAMLVGIALGAPIVALALAGIRRVRRWWFAIWLGAVPITVLLLLIAPVVLDPVFNDFKPLQNASLRDDLLEEAARAGISGARVFQVDKSKQTNTMNAYVNGLGPTTRIVLWDTTIAKMKPDEIRFTMAHEMGHFVLHHVWKMLAFVLGLLLVVFWAGQRAVEAALRRWGRAWGCETAHDPAAVPLLLLVVSAGMFLLTPLMNGVTRHFEHQADVFALELTHDNLAGARAFVKMAEDSKLLPDPSPFIRFWRYSHPTLAERIEFCRTYRPWEHGEPNRVWKGAMLAPQVAGRPPRP